MNETDLDTQHSQSKLDSDAKTPWESIDPPEHAHAEPLTAPTIPADKPPADFATVRAEIPHGAVNQDSPFASTAISAAGAEMAELASEIQLLAKSHQFNVEQAIVTTPARSPDEQLMTQAFLSDDSDVKPSDSLTPTLSPEYDSTSLVTGREEGVISPQFPASSVEPPIEPATIDETSWATMDDASADSTVESLVTPSVDLPHESPVLERLANLDLSEADLDALDATDIGELNRADLLIPQASTDNAAVTFAMTDPVAASIPEMGFASKPVPLEEERPGDATVLIPARAEEVEAEHAITVPQLAIRPQPAEEMELALDVELAPSAVTTGGAWTIPLMCLGIGLIACCVAIPQIDFNRRLRYEQYALAANLESVQKQVAVNDGFLKKVMDDPTLAERLAGRQMKTIRKGQRVVPLEQVSDEGDMSPFALMAVASPPEPAPYRPIRGTIANLCYDARARLYLLGSALTMVAVGLVMGYGRP